MASVIRAWQGLLKPSTKHRRVDIPTKESFHVMTGRVWKVPDQALFPQGASSFCGMEKMTIPNMNREKFEFSSVNTNPFILFSISYSLKCFGYSLIFNSKQEFLKNMLQLISQSFNFIPVIKKMNQLICNFDVQFYYCGLQ